jgi:hypothetical protein
MSKTEEEVKKEYCDELKAYYNERRDKLEKIREDSSESFDKAILQVSTGSLVITITFIDKVGKPYNTLTNILLITFWALFLAVIVLNIFSYLFAKKNMDFRIDDLDERFKKCPDDWLNVAQGKTWYKKAVDFCNSACLYLFLAGAGLFFFYAYVVQTHNFKTSTPKEEVSMTQKITDFKKIETDKQKPEEKDEVKKGQTESAEKVIIKPKPDQKKN